MLRETLAAHCDDAAAIDQWLTEHVYFQSLGDSGPAAYAALRTRIADEPPDPLPSLGFGAQTRDGRVLRAPPVAPPAAPSPFADDTVTQVDLLRPPPPPEDPRTGVTGTTGATTTGAGFGAWVTSDRVVRLALGVAACFLALSAFAWCRWA